jgi:hypothetical protein
MISALVFPAQTLFLLLDFILHLSILARPFDTFFDTAEVRLELVQTEGASRFL